MSKYLKDAEEIEAFKAEINLVDFALANGYEIHKQKDSHKWRALKLTGTDEIIIVHKESNGHYLYFNPDDIKDKGTIVDFVMKKKNLNLGHARKFLRPYLGFVLAPSKGVKQKHHSATPKDIIQDLSSFVDRSYLHSRGISDSTIDHIAFKNKIFNNSVFDDKTGIVYINTAFPITDEQGVIGIEQKNRLPHFNKSFKNVTGLRASGMWISKNTSGGSERALDFIVICESAEKCLAWHQLYYKEGVNCIYISTSGSITDAQIDLLQKVIDKRRPEKLIIGMDNDIAGVRFSTNIIGKVSRHSHESPLDVTSKVLLQGKYDCLLKINAPAEKQEGLTQIIAENLMEFSCQQLSSLRIEFTIAFKNTREALGKAQNLVLGAGDTSFFEVHLSSGKDFNDDLVSTLKTGL